MKDKIIVWMPEFIRSVKASTRKLKKEAKRLNRLAGRLEEKNRKKKEEDEE